MRSPRLPGPEHYLALLLSVSGIALQACEPSSSRPGREPPLDASTLADADAGPGAQPDAFVPPPPGLDGRVRRFCNGDPALCDRAYDAVVHFGTHTSVATSAARWTAPTQGRDVPDQLRQGGVRVLELQVERLAGALAVCAGDCSEESHSLRSVLVDLKAFLEDVQSDVLTLLVHSDEPGSDLAAAFEAEELARYAHAQGGGAPWPTLGALVDSGKRLVVFHAPRSHVDAGSAEAGPTGEGEGGPPVPAWLLPAEAWLRDTMPSVADDCAVADGPPDALIVLRHYDPGAVVTDGGVLSINDATRIAGRLERCRDDRGRLPTFVLVDFADLGDPNGGVQIANGVRAPVMR